MNEQNHWWTLATNPIVVRNAIRMAVIVGSILVLINHGDAVFKGDISATRLLRILITYCVPYTVSTISSVNAIHAVNRERSKVGEGGT